MAPKPSRDAAAAGVPKHRACDECRSRKLACSKESDGCSRCRREGIRCHYSPQKPMGRPRKRRPVDSEHQQGHTSDHNHGYGHGHNSNSPSVSPPRDDVVLHDDFVNVTSGDMAHSAYPASTAYAVPQHSLVLDPSLSFLDQPGGSSMDFLDLLPNPYPENSSGHYDHHAHPIFVADQDQYDGTAFSLHPSGVDLLGGINFDEPDPSAATVNKDFSDSLQRYMASQYSDQPSFEPAESTPSVSTSVPSPEPYPTSNMKPIPSTACGCLSSLYLALDSLTHLPNDVTSAMRTARNSSKVAHDVINCRYCSTPLLDVESPPPIQGFQNMMLLGALLPSACNAYAAILELVDAETARAKEEGRTFFFTFKDVGGLWGNIVGERSGRGPCGVMQSYNNRVMQPDMWRTTIRAILRLDVYGFGEVSEQDRQPGYVQQGLKDVVQLLDQRSRERHDLIDEMIASGQMPKHSPYLLMPNGMRSVPPEQRNCVRILDTARMALDALVIA